MPAKRESKKEGKLKRFKLKYYLFEREIIFYVLSCRFLFLVVYCES